MLNNGRGAINPTVISQSKGLFSKAQQESDAKNIVQLETMNDGIAGKYPIQLGSADPDDVRVALKQQFVGSGGLVSGVGLAIAGDRDFDYLQRKKEEVFYTQFLAYINAQADLTNPASAAWWFERFPFLKEKRLEEINREAEKQKRFAQIQVTGPQNEDDFFLMYLKDQGLIAEPTQPLNKMYADGRYKTNAESFTRGLFSPLSTMPNKNAPGMPDTVSSVPAWKNPFRQEGFGDSVPAAMPQLPTSYGALFPGAGGGRNPVITQ
jgi:hypothetical protein